MGLIGYKFFFVVVVDHVFDQECDNAWVYDLLAKDIIRAAVDGFNGIVWYFLTYFFRVIIIFLPIYEVILLSLLFVNLTIEGDIL